MKGFIFRKEFIAGSFGLTIVLMGLTAVLCNLKMVPIEYVFLSGVATLISALVGVIILGLEVDPPKRFRK